MTHNVFQHLAAAQIEEFRGQTDPEAAATGLAEALSLPDYRFDARSAIRLDYATGLLEFAKQQEYGTVRTASMFDVGHNLLLAVIGGATYEDAQSTLKAQLLERCSPRPGADSHLFSPEQVALVGAYFSRTLFRHYRLYAHTFSHDQDLTEYNTNLLVETAWVLPHELALSQEEYDQKLREDEAAAQAHAAAEAQAAQAAAQAEAVEAEARAKAEAEAKRQAELARKPATLEEAIEHMVAVRLEQEKAVLATEYKAKEDALMKKIVQLEATHGTERATSSAGRSPSARSKSKA